MNRKPESESLTSYQFDSSSRIDRRSVLRMAAGLGAAAVSGGLLIKSAAAQDIGIAATGYYRTSTALRLRTGPGTNYRIILVMPRDALVKDLGGNKNGFRKVSYKGTEGWASLAFLIVADGSSNPDPVLLGYVRTTTAVNFRSGPSLNNQVFRVLAAGTTVQTSDTLQNGFRYVIHNGMAGWVYDSFLVEAGDSPAAGTAVTTTALNLRAEPSTSARILAVMPGNTTVKLTGEGSNGFAKVVYGNLTGWAYTAYLN